MLAVLTGIIADSHMGKYIKTRRERWFFERFGAGVLDRMLAQKTVARTHDFASKEEVFKALASLSTEEEDCYRRVMERRGFAARSMGRASRAEAVESCGGLYGEDTLTAVAGPPPTDSPRKAAASGSSFIPTIPKSPISSNSVSAEPVSSPPSICAICCRSCPSKTEALIGDERP